MGKILTEGIFPSSGGGGGGGVEGASQTRRAVSVSDSALPTDSIIAVTDTSIARTITISSALIAIGTPTVARLVYVKDESGGAGTNNITVDTEGAETIDGVSSLLISVDYGAVKLYSDGSNLFSF